MNSIRTFCSVILILFIAHSKVNAQIDLLSDAVIYYPFDGNCDDYSGNSLHAIGQNLVADTGYYGVEGTCYKHNGTTSKINRPFLNLDDTIALAGWFYSTDLLQNSCLIYNGNSGSDGYGLFIKKSGTTFGLGSQIVAVQGGLSENIVDTSYNLPLNQWTHLVLMIRGSNFELYVNGEFKGAGFRPFNQPTSTFSVGMNPEQAAGGFPAFKGKIDDVVVYRKSLSPVFIGRLFTQGITTHSDSKISAQNELKIYPNPSNGEFSIEGEGVVNINLFDLKGKQLSNVTEINLLSKESKIHVKGLDQGIYLLKIRRSNKTEWRKISLN